MLADTMGVLILKTSWPDVLSLQWARQSEKLTAYFSGAGSIHNWSSFKIVGNFAGSFASCRWLAKSHSKVESRSAGCSAQAFPARHFPIHACTTWMKVV
jgi:hypothetical protein